MCENVLQHIAVRLSKLVRLSFTDPMCMRERKQKTQTKMQAETRMQKAQVETPRERKEGYDNLSQGRQYPGAVSLTRRYPRGQSTTCSTPQVNAVQRRSLCYSMLQRATPCCNVLQRDATYGNVLQRAATCYNVLQRAASYCDYGRPLAALHALLPLVTGDT